MTTNTENELYDRMVRRMIVENVNENGRYDVEGIAKDTVALIEAELQKARIDELKSLLTWHRVGDPMFDIGFTIEARLAELNKGSKE